MSWEERLGELAYTPKSGVRLTAEFEDVSHSFDVKGSSFDFSDADGTYIQKRGNTGRKFPVRLYFTGDDCDLLAEEFAAALREPGFGKLEHTLYGVVDVVPLGAIARRDDLKTAANQSILELTFWETNRLVYPSSAPSQKDTVLTSISQFNTAAAGEFAETTSLQSAVERVTFTSQFEAALDRTRSALDDGTQEFNDLYDSIKSSIDLLVAQPLALANQTVVLIQEPGRAVTDVTAQLSAYAQLAADITQRLFEPGLGSTNSNSFHSADLYAQGYVSGATLTSVNAEFRTKTDALNAAEALLLQLDSVVDWREQQYENLGQVDAGQSYQQLQESVAAAAAYLIDTSFSLQQERILVLDRSRNMLELIAQLYGNIDDDTINFFIDSNALSGSEYLEIQAGRSIVYYV